MRFFIKVVEFWRYMLRKSGFKMASWQTHSSVSQRKLQCPVEFEITIRNCQASKVNVIIRNPP